MEDRTPVREFKNSISRKTDSVGKPPTSIRKLLGRRRLADNTPRSQKRATGNRKDLLPAIKVEKKVTSASTPKTVAEAQEEGELARLQDEITWAVDGLCSQSRSAQEESLVQLLNLLTSRRGRLAISKDDLFREVLLRLVSIKLATSLVALASSLLLLIMSLNAKLNIYDDEKVVHFAKDLLESSLDFDSLCTDRFVNILKDPVLCRLIPREASTNPLSICLASLAYCIEPSEIGDKIKMKRNLNSTGCLNCIVKVASEQEKSLNDPQPTMETVQKLWRLQKCLSILEHASFACPENESYLSTLTMSYGVHPFTTELYFAQWLLNQTNTLCFQILSNQGLKKECLRGFLGVLMNITQDNLEGCKVVVVSNGAQSLCSSLRLLVYGDPDGSHFKMDRLKYWIDEICSCLAVLINVVESSPEAKEQMLFIKYNSNGHDEVLSVIELLVMLFNFASDSLRLNDKAEASGEVTLDALHHNEREALGSTLKVYSSILLGFLIVDSLEGKNKAKSLLQTHSLESITNSISKCLGFYRSAGAMTEKTEASLQTLLKKLSDNL